MPRRKIIKSSQLDVVSLSLSGMTFFTMGLLFHKYPGENLASKKTKIENFILIGCGSFMMLLGGAIFLSRSIDTMRNCWKMMSAFFEPPASPDLNSSNLNQRVELQQILLLNNAQVPRSVPIRNIPLVEEAATPFRESFVVRKNLFRMPKHCVVSDEKPSQLLPAEDKCRYSWRVIRAGALLTKDDLSTLSILEKKGLANSASFSMWRITELQESEDVMSFFDEWKTGVFDAKLLNSNNVCEMRHPRRDTRILGVNVAEKKEVPLIVWCKVVLHARLSRVARDLDVKSVRDLLRAEGEEASRRDALAP